MGQYLWNPEREPNDAARKYAYWQAADAVNGERFAEALLAAMRQDESSWRTEIPYDG